MHLWQGQLQGKYSCAIYKKTGICPVFMTGPVIHTDQKLWQYPKFPAFLYVCNQEMGHPARENLFIQASCQIPCAATPRGYSEGFSTAGSPGDDLRFEKKTWLHLL